MVGLFVLAVSHLFVSKQLVISKFSSHWRSETHSPLNASLTSFAVSEKLVPLTIIKGASQEFIPFPTGENATVADFHS